MLQEHGKTMFPNRLGWDFDLVLSLSSWGSHMIGQHLLLNCTLSTKSGFWKTGKITTLYRWSKPSSRHFHGIAWSTGSHWWNVVDRLKNGKQVEKLCCT